MATRRQRIEKSLAGTSRGIHVPVDTGYAVHHEAGSIGAGPVGNDNVRRTSNGFLHDRLTQTQVPLWIHDFSADYSVTGVEAQSRLKNDFWPRFFTQPRYQVKAQCFNQEQYNRIVKFVRQSMLRQLGTPNEPQRPDLLVLKIEDKRWQNGASRTTKGGYTGWKMTGYIDKIAAGAERFVNAPEIEFTFVQFNVEEGLVNFDRLEHDHRIARYLRPFGGRTPDPGVELLDPWSQTKKKEGKKVEKPAKAPVEESEDITIQEVVNIGSTIWDLLTGG